MMAEPPLSHFPSLASWITSPLRFAFNSNEDSNNAPSEDGFHKMRGTISAIGVLKWPKTDEASPQTAFDWLKKLLFDRTYASSPGLVTLLQEQISSDLDQCRLLRERAYKLQEKIATMKYVESTDPDVNQRAYLEGFSETQSIGEDINELTQKMATRKDTFAKILNDVRGKLFLLRTTWKECAISLESGRDSPLATGGRSLNAWFDNLRTWSNFVDCVDNAILFCDQSYNRYSALYEHYRIQQNLDQVAERWLDCYASCTTGMPDQTEDTLASLRAEGVKVLEWMTIQESKSLPFDAKNPYGHWRQSHCGSYRYDLRRGGLTDVYAQKSSFMLPQPLQDDFQIGISEIDFDKWCTLAWDYAGHEGNLRRTWKEPVAKNKGFWHPDSNSYIYQSARMMYVISSSFVSIPTGSFRDGIHFGWALVRRRDPNKERDYIIELPGRDPVQQGDIGVLYGEQYEWKWDIYFPEPFRNEKFNIRPWIMDFSQTSWQQGRGGVKLDVVGKSRWGFQLQVSWPRQVKDFDKLKIGYLMQMEDQDIYAKGLWCERLDRNLGYPNRTNNDNYKAKFLSFREGMFKRTPAVATMLRSFITDLDKNPRIGVDYAASRDGIVVRGYAWADTELHEASWEIFAVRNELESPSEPDGTRSTYIS